MSIHDPKYVALLNSSGDIITRRPLSEIVMFAEGEILHDFAAQVTIQKRVLRPDDRFYNISTEGGPALCEYDISTQRGPENAEPESTA